MDDAEHVVLRGGHAELGGWPDAMHGGLQKKIRVNNCLRLVAGVGDGGALGTVTFFKASSR
jgi:hypothetical protein